MTTPTPADPILPPQTAAGGPTGTTAAEPRPESAPTAAVPATLPTPLVPKPTEVPDHQLADLQQRLAEYQRRDAENELRTKASTYQRQLEADGWPEALAAVQAKTWLDKETAEARYNAAMDEHEQNAKFTVAQRLASEYGVSADVLIGYSTPSAMLNAAQRLGGDAKRIAALEAEVAALKGGTVPDQRFDANTGGPVSSDDAFLAAYSHGQSNDHARAKKLLGM